ncbi:MAG TPA: hypothetical protein ENN29_11935 [Candidatus Hydrogenedentes bacterium]|nr:hypothetical protein [Candidatus Hydrogenedentota bacterium]
MRFSQMAGSRGYLFGVLASVVVALPALWFGFFVDDYLFLATMAGLNPIGSSFDLYVFGSGDPEQMLSLIQNGPYPWFGDPDFKVHFFRPLASALMTLDRVLFGHCAVAYSAHSILWYVLLCFAAMLIFRRTLPPAAGVLALFLFVVDESHALPTAWWSNRHSIMAVGLGLLGVAAHLRWREDRWRPGLPLSLAAYVLSLLSTETGLCVLAYPLAYELFSARDGVGKRVLSILPASLLAIGYLLLYRWGGYGARYSDIYIDPVGDPVAFLSAAPARFAMLAGAQFFMLPVEASIVHVELERPFIVLGGVGLALVALALYNLWPHFEERERHALRWLIPGAAMATVPALAAIVNARVLVAPSLGGAAIIAVVIAHLWRARRAPEAVSWKPATMRMMRVVLWALVVGHLGIAALSWPAQVTALRVVMNHLNKVIRTCELDESRITETQVVVFNAPDPYTGLYPLMLRSFDGRAVPRSWWTISFAPYAHRITRTGAREVEIEVVGGEMFASIMERLFRSRQRPLDVGYEMDLNGLRVIVAAVGNTGPTRLRLVFEDAPESDRYQLLAFRDGRYRRLTLPAPGDAVDLPFGFR